jgi:hypothetical protein
MESKTRLTPEEIKEIEARAKDYVENHPDVEVRRMYGHYFRVYVAGASFERIKAKAEVEELTSKLIEALDKERDRIDELESLLVEKEAEIAELKAKFKPVQLCPKCQGTGVLSKPPGVPFDVTGWSSSSAVHTCDICSGRKTV